MKKFEHDFFSFTSFPSSIKLINDEPEVIRYPKPEMKWFWTIPVDPEKILIKTVVKVKQANVPAIKGRIWAIGWNGVDWIGMGFPDELPLGSFDWITLETEREMPLNTSIVRLQLNGGGGTKEKPSTTWFDDLKIYQNGELIYSNDFANWNPYLGAGLGGLAGGVGGYELTKDIPTTIGISLLGSLIGAGIGLIA